MSDGIWSAASGAVGQLLALDVAADNVANAGTPGFQGGKAVFHEQLARAGAKGVGDLRYAAVGSVVNDTSPGPIVSTGRGLDVAIKGDGWFAVKSPQGERYTRGGAFQVGKDGTLSTHDGLPVLGSNRQPIRVGEGASSATIGDDGTVYANKQSVGQLMVVKFAAPSALEKQGGTLMRATAAAGAPVVTQPTLETSALEGSNVSVVRGMVEIVGASRNFEACEKAIEVFRDADRKAALDIFGKD